MFFLTTHSTCELKEIIHHTVFWMIGTAGLYFTHRYISQSEKTNEGKTYELLRQEAMLTEARKITKLGCWEKDFLTGETLCDNELRHIINCPSDCQTCSIDHLRSFILIDDTATFDESFRKAVETAENQECTFRLLYKSGEIKYLHQRLKAYLDESGEVAKIIAAITDITELKNKEEAIAKAEKMISIGNMAAGIAHDFNNFLTIILGNASLIHGRCSDGLIKEFAANIQQTVETAAGLSGQLMSYAKNSELIMSPLEPKKILTEIAQSTLKDSQIRLEFELADDLWPILADKNQLSQVFSNLLINACQAMKNVGKISIRASNAISEKIDSHATMKNYLRIIVTDNGPGMPEEIREKAFEAYFTSKKGGRGLGLFMAHSIIVNHGGHIEVFSEPGKGTTFIIHLPADPQAILPDEPSSNEQKALPKKALRILLMDDERMIGDSFSQILKESGHDCTWVADGQEMLAEYAAKMATDRYDICILDAVIPSGMGGLEVIAPLLTLDEKAKAILHSGYIDPETANKYLQLGFVGCLQKPAKMSTLLSMLSEV